MVLPLLVKGNVEWSGRGPEGGDVTFIRSHGSMQGDCTCDLQQVHMTGGLGGGGRGGVAGLSEHPRGTPLPNAEETNP